MSKGIRFGLAAETDLQALRFALGRRASAGRAMWHRDLGGQFADVY